MRKVVAAVIGTFFTVWLPFAGVCKFQWWGKPECKIGLHPKYEKARKHYDKWKKARQPKVHKPIIKQGE